MLTSQVEIQRNKKFALTAQMHEHATTFPEFDGRKIYTEPEALVKAILSVQNYYGFDLPILGYDVYNIEAEALGQKLKFKENSSPQQPVQQPILSDSSDLQVISLPQNQNMLKQRGRFSFILKATELFQKKTGTLPYLQFTSPFSLAARLAGFENFLISLLSNPAYAHKLLEKVTGEVLIPWISLQKQQFPGSDIFLGADALASPPNLTTNMLEDLVLPYINILKEELGEGVGVVNWWGESHVKDLKKFLDLKRKVSPHNKHLRVQDPDLYNINLNYLIDYVKHYDMHLTLGVSARLLIQGDKNEIKKRLEKYVPLCDELPHLTLYLCNLGRDTPRENIKLAVKTARRIYKDFCGSEENDIE